MTKEEVQVIVDYVKILVNNDKKVTASSQNIQR